MRVWWSVDITILVLLRLQELGWLILARQTWTNLQEHYGTRVSLNRGVGRELSIIWGPVQNKKLYSRGPLICATWCSSSSLPRKYTIHSCEHFPQSCFHLRSERVRYQNLPNPSKLKGPPNMCEGRVKENIIFSIFLGGETQIKASCCICFSSWNQYWLQTWKMHK